MEGTMKSSRRTHREQHRHRDRLPWRIGWATLAGLLVVALSACDVAFTNDRLAPIYVQRTTTGFLIANPCDISIPSLRVEQPPGFTDDPTFKWQAIAIADGLSQLPFPTDAHDDYPMEASGTLRPEQESVVLASYSGSGSGRGIIVTFADLAIGDVAYDDTIVPEAEWPSVRLRTFGC
jgi:hypothetical protein